MKRIGYGFALALALNLSVLFTAPAAFAGQATPTPCYGATYPTQTIVMGGDIVNVSFSANATGYQGSCDYSYTEHLWTKYSSNMSVWFKIRAWGLQNGICGEFLGTYQSNGYQYGKNLSYTTPDIYYGSCRHQADNYGTIITIGFSTYTICYQCAGYENFA